MLHDGALDLVLGATAAGHLATNPPAITLHPEGLALGVQPDLTAIDGILTLFAVGAPLALTAVALDVPVMSRKGV